MKAEGLRPGEIRLELPTHFDAELVFIGRLRTPWTDREDCPKNARGSDAVCRVEIDARYREAMSGLEAMSHLILLYWMDRADRDLAVQRPRHHGAPRGTFSIRSPARPNPIALSVVTLLDVEGATLRVRGLDCLDGTPLLDIKPYLPAVDAYPEARASWPDLPLSEETRSDIDREGQNRRVEEE
jgi:tRNA-Thr(GGU) m(6)t(6)A37 methyltransferase TsaA